MMRTLMKISVLMLVLAVTSVTMAEPGYQAIPTDPAQILASGVADATGPGGTAYVEYWVWNGGNGYYYYTYRIHNPEGGFLPFVKHLTIGNPTGTQYIVTGSSGGGAVGGTAWNASSHLSLPTLVDWISTNPSNVIYPGQSSWESPLFQFASTLPPTSASLTVREGSLATYANGLVPAPGSSTGANAMSTGYWKHQYSGKGARKEAAALPGYMNNIAMYSQVFATDLAGSVTADLAAGTTILSVPDNSDMRQKARCQLFGLWLNVVSQKLDYYGKVTFDPAVINTTATNVKDVIAQCESTILNAAATDAQLETVKDMAEILNCN